MNKKKEQYYKNYNCKSEYSSNNSDEENCFLKSNKEKYKSHSSKNEKIDFLSKKKYLPSELKSFKEDNSYLIFSANGCYYSPSDIYNQYDIHKKKKMKLPLGSCRYLAVHNPGNTYDVFVFSNLKKQNEKKIYKEYIKIYNNDKNSIIPRKVNTFQKYNRQIFGYDNINLENKITSEDLKDLDNILWYRSKPRIQRPYRIIADQKSCIKNLNTMFSTVMRKGL